MTTTAEPRVIWAGPTTKRRLEDITTVAIVGDKVEVDASTSYDRDQALRKCILWEVAASDALIAASREALDLLCSEHMRVTNEGGHGDIDDADAAGVIRGLERALVGMVRQT